MPTPPNSPTLPSILVVDDEPRSLETLRRTLEEEFEVKTAASAKEARALLQRDWVQIVLCDQRMPDTTGVAFLKQVRDHWPDPIRMIISGYTDSQEIIEAVNEAGIYQYITKPWHPESLLLTLRNAARLYDLQRTNELLGVELKMSPRPLAEAVSRKQRSLKRQYRYSDGIVRSPASSMNQVCEQLAKVAPFDISVLLSGESGTGKELAARALHYNSRRGDKPFVVENCGALPDELLESELFGYKRGAFTGAVEDREGLFQRADGGTVFLDEIGDVSPAFQVKLLRVLQEGEVRPLGGARTQRVDVRVVAATNKDLENEVRSGRFREDLYYRLAAVTIHLPPLRERREDTALIAQALLDNAQHVLGKQVQGFSKAALAHICAHHWPGNVRELQNEIRRMLVMSEGDTLGVELLSPKVLGEAQPPTPTLPQGDLKQRVATLEAEILRDSLSRHRWNISRVAEELGLSRVGLRGKLTRYDIQHHDAP